MSALLVGLTPALASAATTVTSGGTFTYGEQDPPLAIGTGITVSDGGFYDGRSVEFQITGATAQETLALITVSTPSTGAGVVSVVGTAVYVGDGTTALPIGSIDSVSNGQHGTKLKVNFGSDFRNPGFETGSVDPWTKVEQMVELGVTSIAGFVANDTATYPANSGGDNDVPVSATYSVTTATGNPPGPTEGTYALKLTSNMTTKNGCDVVHGPAAYSAPFDSAVGQVLSFDWRAYAGSDAYSVFGYLLNTATGAQTEVLDTYTTNVSGTTAWATKSVTVPETGTYRFVFVSGTYDGTCGKAAGASLYIDNFRVVSSSLVNDAMVTSLSHLLTYSNSSDNPTAVRTVTETATSISSGAASAAITVNVTPVNDPPVGTPATEQWENTPANDTFADITNTMAFADPDNPTLSYSIVGGTDGTFTVGGVTYDHQLVGTYGTLYISAATGAYRIVANDPAIEAVTNPVAETFTVAASDGAATGTAVITLGIQLPPAPRNVVGTAGNGQVTVHWDQPGVTTGITGYTAIASPGGQTCTTVGVASTTCVITGLTNGTSYTFTVVPTTGSGPGTTSLASDPVTPSGPPDAPISVVATPGDGRVLMTWDPPTSNGGSPITGYAVSSSPGGGSCTTTGATSCTVLGLAIGSTYTLTVRATNANGNGPLSSSVQVTIKGATTTALTSSQSQTVQGESVTLTAAVTGTSPTGTVTFFDGSTNLGTGTIAGGTASLTTTAIAPGHRTITAVYGGNATNYGSTSNSTPITVLTPATVGLSPSTITPVEGHDVVLTATVGGSSPTGTVEFFDGATSLGTASVVGGVAELTVNGFVRGIHAVTAVYSGDGLNTTDTSTAVGLTVLAAAAVDLQVSSPSAIVGDPLTFSVAVSGASPTGTVELFDGTTSLGTASLVGGAADIIVSNFGPGVHTVRAVYSGDGSNTDATSADVSATVKAVSTAVLDTSAPTAIAGNPVTISVAVTGFNPSGIVDFFDGTTGLGSAVVVNGVATITVNGLVLGAHTVRAEYVGDALNTPATAGQVTLTVVAPPTGHLADPSLKAGADIKVTGQDFAPNSQVDVWVTGNQLTFLGTVTTDSHGSFSTSFTMPKGLSGDLNVELRGVDAIGTPTATPLVLNIQSEVLPAIGDLPATVSPTTVSPAGDVAAGAALPTTGSNPVPITGLALALIGLGSALVLSTRRNSGGRRRRGLRT